MLLIPVADILFQFASKSKPPSYFIQFCSLWTLKSALIIFLCVLWNVGKALGCCSSTHTHHICSFHFPTSYTGLFLSQHQLWVAQTSGHFLLLLQTISYKNLCLQWLETLSALLLWSICFTHLVVALPSSCLYSVCACTHVKKS